MQRIRLLLCLFSTILVAFIAPAAAGNVWVRGEAGEPGSLDPHKGTTVIENRILDELYEGLLVYDGEGKLQPGVAARWDVSDDKRIYTFHLRPDAKWSNGTPVTAEDFVFALRRLMDPKTGAPYANILYTLKNARGVNRGEMPLEQLGARALDPLTLELTLEQPTAYLLEQLTHLTALPLYKPSLDKWGSSFARAGRMIGNGAFMLKSYTPNDRLVLVKNPYFHDAAQVALDGEVFVPIDDQSAGLRRFMAGEIDSYDSLPIDQMAFIQANLDADLKVVPYLATYYYDFDTRKKPFDDWRVRQALAMVIDREFLAKTIWGGTMAPAYSFVPPGIASYGTPAMVRWKDERAFQREDEAKQLMKAAGYGPDHPLHLTFRYNQSQNHKATAVAIADMWRVLNVTTEFIVSDATSHYAFLQSGQSFDVIRSGWFADYPDAQNYLFLAESDNKGLNYAHFSDPAYDRLMRAAAVEPDVAKRRDILHKAEALLLEKMPVVPLMIYEAPNLVSPRLRGWTANVLDHHPGRYVSKKPDLAQK